MVGSYGCFKIVQLGNARRPSLCQTGTEPVLTHHFAHCSIAGATSGIGRAVASACAKRGAKVVLACRDKVKAEATITSIRRKTKNEDVHFLTLDLASLQSVRDCATTFCRHFGRVDVLINNAGIPN